MPQHHQYLIEKTIPVYAPYVKVLCHSVDIQHIREVHPFTQGWGLVKSHPYVEVNVSSPNSMTVNWPKVKSFNPFTPHRPRQIFVKREGKTVTHNLDMPGAINTTVVLEVLPHRPQNNYPVSYLSCKVQVEWEGSKLGTALLGFFLRPFLSRWIDLIMKEDKHYLEKTHDTLYDDLNPELHEDHLLIQAIKDEYKSERVYGAL